MCLRLRNFGTKVFDLCQNKSSSSLNLLYLLRAIGGATARWGQRQRFRNVFRSFREFFWKTTALKKFGDDRFCRWDPFRPKVVEIGAILVIFQPFEVFGCFRASLAPPFSGPTFGTQQFMLRGKN